MKSGLAFSRAGLAAGLCALLATAGCELPRSSGNSTKLPTQLIRAGYFHDNALILRGPPPTIVFESNLGETLTGWAMVEPEVAPYAATFAYDRGGLGGSEKGPAPRDAKQIALELRTALQAAKLPPPYILVAHSAGAFYARVFAGDYPEEVAGIVLVEPAAEEFFDQLKAREPSDYRVFTLRRDNPKAPQGVRAEAAAWDTDSQEARAAVLPKVPVTVITAEGSWPQLADLWWQAHENLLAGSPLPRHVLARHSGHYVQLTDPGLVAQCILEILSDYRAGAIKQTNPVPPASNP
jgi:pimeloyl-ACP methyl ester carboxylesterase